LTIAAVGALYLFVWSTIDGLDTEAKPLPVPELSEQVEREVEFTERTIKRIADEGAGGELVLSPDLLNAWVRLSSRPPIRFVGEHSWLTLDGSSIIADVALPLSPLGFPDRFFNGKLTLEGHLTKGEISLLIKSVTPEGAAAAIEWLSWLLVDRDLAEPFGLVELLGPDIVNRCTIEAVEAKLRMSCLPAGSAPPSLATQSS